MFWFWKETKAIGLSALVLGLGFLTVAAAKYWLGIGGDAVYVALFLLPVVVYLVISGRLSELKAGGLEAKFATVSRQSVELSAETVDASMQEMEVVFKAGARELAARMNQLSESTPITLALSIGRAGYYERKMLLKYMEALSGYRSFKFVVFLGSEKRLEAYIPYWALMEILREESLGEEFIGAVNQGNLGYIKRFPRVVTKTLSPRSTYINALQEMADQRLEAMVVVDEKRQLKGIVEREQILSG